MMAPTDQRRFTFRDTESATTKLALHPHPLGYEATHEEGSRSMNAPYTPDLELEKRLSGRLLDVLIRAGLVFAMAVLCYQIFSPFLALMAWALILAVTLYPAHQKLARRMGGKQGLAATMLVLGGIVLIGVPTAVLMFELGDSVHHFVGSVRDHTLQIPAPSPSVAEWPIVGKKVHGFWSQAHTDLPALVQSLQPKLGDLAKTALGVVASIGGALLLFLASFIIAGIIMAFGESGARSTRAIFDRIVGTGRGEEFAKLSTATIRAVALGVLGVAFIQAIVVGLVLLIAGVPFAGVLALVVLVLGIAQVPALLVTLPVIAYIWMSGDYGTGAAVTYTRAAVRRRHARQRAEAAAARPRCRCADGRDPARRVGRPGNQRSPGDVRRRDVAGPGLSDLHVVGRDQS